MPSYRVPVLAWQDYDGLYTACSVEPSSELVGTATSLKDALAQVRAYLEYAYRNEAWMQPPEIKNERVETVAVPVRPVYTTRERTFPCDEIMTLRIPCVVGERADRLRVCSIPTLGIQFDYYRKDSFEDLVRENVRSMLANSTPAQLSQFLPAQEYRLEKIHVRLKKPRRQAEWEFRPSELPAVADSLAEKHVRRRFGTAWQRDREVRALVDNLQREQSCVLLIGDRGVGKTTLLMESIRELLRLSKQRKQDSSERDDDAGTPRFYLTSAARLIAGMQYLGEWQQRCEAIVEELSMIDGVLCVENLLDLVRTGGEGASDSVAAFFRTFIQHGELRIVAEVTPDELNACDRLLPGLTDAFQKVIVNPLSPDDTVSALNHLVDQEMERGSRHLARLGAEPGLVETVTRLYRRFLPYHTLPGPAAAFLRELVTHVRDTADDVSSQQARQQRRARVENRAHELLDLFTGGTPSTDDGLSSNDGGNTIAASETETDANAAEGETASAPDKPAPTTLVTAGAVRSQFAKQTGLPDLFLRDDMPLDYDDVFETLRGRVIGQDAACRSASTVITTFKAGLNDVRRPISVQLFCGPTGVGKTQLAREISRFCFGHGDETNRLVRLDMSEYSGWNAAKRLLQRSDGGPGALVERVRRQPFIVLLLDEIEKAAPDVFDVLLNVFEEGTLTDPWGRRTFFQSAIIIMTSNLGADSLRRAGFGGGGSPTWEREVERFFRPEFVNRIDEIVTFGTLEKDSIVRITELELSALNDREGLKEFGRRIQATEKLIAHIATRGFDARYGARPLQRFLESFVVAPLSRFLLENTDIEGTIRLDCDEAGNLLIEAA